MSMQRLLDIMARLRDPARGCPWDLEQDFASIAPYTIEEAYEGEVWVEKVNSSAILNDRDVQLIASDGTDGLGEPLSPDEAVAACEAVRTTLERRQPQLTVEALNGDTVVAHGEAKVPCVPV